MTLRGDPDKFAVVHLSDKGKLTLYSQDHDRLQDARDDATYAAKRGGKAFVWHYGVVHETKSQ